MRVEILGAERRRRWGDERKLAIVLSVGVDGATVSEVARRHDVTRQQIYTWRRELRNKGLLSSASAKTVFLPVDLCTVQDASPPDDVPLALPSAIELQLNCGRSLRFDSGVDATILTRLIRAVESA